ncbi:MAG: pyridoxamine 5'-phosphate oxidase family protein [Agriterribacter sp.]
MSTENLYSTEAIDKLKSLAKKTDIGMLCTHFTVNEYVHAVPMSTQEVDDAGDIWFLFSSDSETYKHLLLDNAVSLLYSDVRDYNFLSINGTAVISDDKSRIEKYWNKMMDGWFEKGKEDPTIRVLQVTPVEAHYWDNKTNKLVTFLKVAASAISGQKLDIGREGNLNI